MPRMQLQPKRVGEIITAEFSFSEFMEPSDTIVSAVCSCEVVAGIDPYPERRILGDARISGMMVKQWIVGGAIGVTYLVTCTGILSNGQEEVVEALLSVIPGYGTSSPFGPEYPATLVLSGDAPDGLVGDVYSYSYSVVGGVIPYTSSIPSGAIPTGLTLPPNSLTLNGTLTEAGIFTFDVRADDRYGNWDRISDTVTVRGYWFAGPIAINGASGGSENYYKVTNDPTDWSGAPVALPLGRTGLRRISAVQGKVFMSFTAANGVVSSDYGFSWTACDTSLPNQDVYWNGSYYVCGTIMSADGITWTTIPNLSGTPDFTAARPLDSVIVCLYSATPSRLEYSFDSGANWTVLNPTGTFVNEAFYSLTLDPNSVRIHWSIANFSTTGISGFFSDDYFVNQQKDGGTFSGVYTARYGCSRLVQYEFSNRLIYSQDKAFSWVNSQTGLTITSSNHFMTYGENIWAAISRLSLGPPQSHQVLLSLDGAESWTTGVATLYGSVSSIEYIGSPGDCSVYPAPDYSILTDIFMCEGSVGASTYLSTRTWGTGGNKRNPYISRDGQYILTNLNTSEAVRVYKKYASGFGYELLTSPFDIAPTTNSSFSAYAMSYDNQYMAIKRASGSGDGIYIYRLVAGVYTQLTVPGLNSGNIDGLMFSPTSYTLVVGDGTSSIFRVYTISGNTVSGPFNSASLGNDADTIDIDDTGTWAVTRTNANGIRVVDISDPASGVPIVGTIGAAATSSGSAGIFFSPGASYIYTVSPGATSETDGNIHIRSWDGSTIGLPTLIHTPAFRVQSSHINATRKYLAIVRDLQGPQLSICVFNSAGDDIESEYSPVSNQSSAFAVWWMNK